MVRTSRYHRSLGGGGDAVELCRGGAVFEVSAPRSSVEAMATLRRQVSSWNVKFRVLV